MHTESCDVGALSTSNLPAVLIHLLKESQEQRADVTDEVLELITDTLLEGDEGNVHLFPLYFFIAHLQGTCLLNVGLKHLHKKASFVSCLPLLTQNA